MDALTRQARELVIVELREVEGGPWYWDGLTWNARRDKAQQMERGRAEILVAQSRRRLEPGLKATATWELIGLEATPAAEKPLTAHQVARDLKQLLGADVALTPMRWREEDR